MIQNTNINNNNESIMLKLLADRLVEAFSEWLHLKIRTEYWGYSQESSSSIETLITRKYTGIRPAIGYSVHLTTAKKKLFSDC